MDKKKSCFVLFVVFFFFYFLNWVAPLFFGDDMLYAFQWKDGVSFFNQADWSMPRVDSFSALFQSVYSHYLYWHGRLLAVFLNFLFMWTGKPFFDVCNTLVILLLGCLVCWVSDKGKLVLPGWKQLLFVYCCFFYLTFNFVSVFLWLSGSCNYVWSSLIVLLFLLPYIRRYYDVSLSDVSGIALFLVGFIAGSTNENVVVSVLIFLLVLMYRERSLLRYRGLCFGFLGLCVGCVVMLFSPGVPFRLLCTFTEMASCIGNSQDFQYVVFVDETLRKLRDGEFLAWLNPYLLKDNLMGILYFYFSNLFLVICHLVGIWFVPSGNKDGWFVRFLFFFGHLSLWVMLFSPYLPGRSFFMTELCSIAGILIMFRYFAGNKQIQKFFNFILGLLFVVSVVVGGIVLEKGWQHKSDYDRFCRFVQLHREDMVVVYMPSSYLIDGLNTWFSPFTVVDFKCDRFYVRCAARYYGVKDIVVYRDYDGECMVLASVSSDGKLTGYSVK